VGAVENPDQTPELNVRLYAHYRRNVLMREGDLQRAIAMLEYALARRGLAVHALNKVKEVRKWELAGDREKALEANKGEPGEKEAKNRTLWNARAN
jgi:hypothetical protein